jgi:hypothetical protein
MNQLKERQRYQLRPAEKKNWIERMEEAVDAMPNRITVRGRGQEHEIKYPANWEIWQAIREWTGQRSRFLLADENDQEIAEDENEQNATYKLIPERNMSERMAPRIVAMPERKVRISGRGRSTQSTTARLLSCN